MLITVVIVLTACEKASDKLGDGSQAPASSESSSTTTAPAASATTTTVTPEVDPKEVATREFASIGDTVLFDFDSSALSETAQDILDRQVEFLQRNREMRVIVGGHADERGTREYNLALGERRAAGVRDYFVTRGLNAERIRIISHGKERPAVVGSNESAWRQNRRAQSVLY